MRGSISSRSILATVAVVTPYGSARGGCYFYITTSSTTPASYRWLRRAFPIASGAALIFRSNMGLFPDYRFTPTPCVQGHRAHSAELAGRALMPNGPQSARQRGKPERRH
jgi:hypothetical protein